VCNNLLFFLSQIRIPLFLKIKYTGARRRRRWVRHECFRLPSFFWKMEKKPFYALKLHDVLTTTTWNGPYRGSRWCFLLSTSSILSPTICKNAKLGCNEQTSTAEIRQPFIITDCNHRSSLNCVLRGSL